MAALLVVGASRGIGFETVKAALAAGHTVRALARSVDKLSLDHPRLEKVRGDALDRTAVERAVDGMDCVVQSLGVPINAAAVLNRTTLFSTATRVLVDAMLARRVRRLIAITGAGTGNSRDSGPVVYTRVVFPLLLKRVYDDKDVQEQIIKASGLDWVIARPGALTNGPLTRRYEVLVSPESWGSGLISRADVADFVVRNIADDTYLRQTPLLVASSVMQAFGMGGGAAAAVRLRVLGSADKSGWAISWCSCCVAGHDLSMTSAGSTPPPSGSRQ